MSPRRETAPPRELWHQRAVLLVLVTAFFGQMVLGAPQLSLTSDEPPHTAHGYLMLATGDTWALNEHRHPPLLNAWTAWPLFLQPDRPDVTAIAGWRQDFVVFVRSLWPTLGPVDRWAFATRYPNMLLGVLLLAVVVRWARSAFGRQGALVAACLMAFDPTMVAHAQLNTTDVGLALLAFSAIFCAGRGRLVSPAGRPRLLIWLAIGVLLGGVAAAKGSGVMVAPIVLVIVLWRAWRASRRLGVAPDRFVRQMITHSALMGVSAVLTLWATYGFGLEPVAGLPLRLPLVAHAEMVHLILSESRRVAFLAGEIRWGGWWWYFPFAFLVKTPLPALALTIGATFTLLRRPRELLRQPELWLYPAFYMATSIASGMNIGYRHLLSVLPFTYVAVAAFVEALIARRSPPPPTRHATRSSHALRLIVVALLGWQAVEAIAVAPFSLAYFNELVGGPRNGYRYLVDSNYDWGQSFKALADYMKARAIDETWLSYYTWIDPAAYDIAYRPLPPAAGTETRFPQPYNPQPGIYALSATPLQGIMLADPDTYDWFRHREPVAQPGYGILVYDVQAGSPEPTWLAQCSVPAAPLSDAAVARGFGRSDLRTITFDCTRGWILPNDGTTRGWYALHADVIADHQTTLTPFLADTTLSYRQREPRTLPAFALYERSPKSAAPPNLVDPPIRIGPLSLIGSRSERTDLSPDASLTIDTWWRVNAIPERPLSLMLHIGTPGGIPIAVGDGLAIPKEVWRVGDVLIQHHQIHVPADALPGQYTATTGAYWLDDLERIAVTSSSSGETAVELFRIRIEQIHD